MARGAGAGRSRPTNRSPHQRQRWPTRRDRRRPQSKRSPSEPRSAANAARPAGPASVASFVPEVTAIEHRLRAPAGHLRPTPSHRHGVAARSGSRPPPSPPGNAAVLSGSSAGSSPRSRLAMGDRPNSRARCEIDLFTRYPHDPRIAPDWPPPDHRAPGLPMKASGYGGDKSIRTVPANALIAEHRRSACRR